MKIRLMIIVVIVTITSQLKAQSHVAGTLSVQAGYDFAVHSTEWVSKFGGFVIDSDNSTAATNMLGGTVQYNALNWLSGGVSFSYGSYIEDTSDAGANGNNVANVNLELRAYPINGERFNLYVGPEFGFSSLDINRTVFGIDEIYKYRGNHLGANLGFNWYIVSFMGIFAQLEYTANQFELKDYYLGNDKVDLTNFDVSLDTRSFGTRIGLCFKIN